LAEDILLDIVLGVRLLVAGAFALSLIVAVTHWAVRRGSISAFGAWPRFVRGWSDGLLRPIERRLARSGGNPQDAPLWLIGTTVVGGLVLLGLVDWAIRFGLTLYERAQSGALLITVVNMTFELLKLAIMIRVLSSWISVGRYSRFMRLIYALTDWIVEPIHRIVPPLGMFDFSPLIAWLVLSFAENLVMRGMF